MKRLILALLLLAVTGLAWPQAPLCNTCSTNSFNFSIINPPTYTDAIVLAGSSQTQTVPSGVTWLVFSATCNFYAKRGASAAVPDSTTTNGSAAMLNPSAWYVAGLSQLTVVSSANPCIVTLSFYQ